MEVFEKSDAEVRTKRTWLFVGQLVPILLWGLAWRLFPSVGLVPAYVGMLALVIGCGQVWRRWPVVRRVALRADAAGLHLGGRLVVARKAIRTAHVHTRDGSTFVRLARGIRPVELVVDDERHGEALIEALRLDPSRSVVRYTLVDGSVRQMLARTGVIAAAFIAVITASVFAVILLAGVAAAPVAAALLLVAYFVLLTRQFLTLSVGADGIRIRRWFGAARFFRYSEMRDITVDGSTVSLRLRDGKTLTMSKGGAGALTKRLAGTEIQEETEGLVARVTARIAAHGGHDDAGVRAALAKGERPTAAWLRALRLYADTTATFRTPAIPPDVFWRVVEDTTAPPTARVGAAVALHGTLDDAARARLRVAAEACAAPKLRIALEAAACTEDERALSAALDSLVDDGEAPRRTSRA